MVSLQPPMFSYTLSLSIVVAPTEVNGKCTWESEIVGAYSIIGRKKKYKYTVCSLSHNPKNKLWINKNPLQLKSLNVDN